MITQVFIVVGCAAFLNLSRGPCVFTDLDSCIARTAEIMELFPLDRPPACRRETAPATKA